MTNKCDAQHGVANGSVMDCAVILVEGHLAWCNDRRIAQLACSSAQCRSGELAYAGHMLTFAMCVPAWSDQGQR